MKGMISGTSGNPKLNKFTFYFQGGDRLERLLVYVMLLSVIGKKEVFRFL